MEVSEIKYKKASRIKFKVEGVGQSAHLRHLDATSTTSSFLIVPTGLQMYLNLSNFQLRYDMALEKRLELVASMYTWSLGQVVA